MSHDSSNGRGRPTLAVDERASADRDSIGWELRRHSTSGWSVEALQLDITWQTPWWVWNPETAGIGDWGYRLFNLFEGLVWLILGGLVIIRWYRFRRTCAEWAYAGAFVAFGLTDFREAYAQAIPLVLVKGAVLVWLMVLRHRATNIWYPGAKLY